MSCSNCTPLGHVRNTLSSVRKITIFPTKLSDNLNYPVDYVFLVYEEITRKKCFS